MVAEKKRCEDKRRQREEQRKHIQNNIALTSSSDEDNFSAEDDEVYAQTYDGAAKNRKPVHVVSPELQCALDRKNVSDRNATFLLVFAAHSLGYDVADFGVNCFSISRARIFNRKQLALAVKLDFSFVSVPLVVH